MKISIKRKSNEIINFKIMKNEVLMSIRIMRFLINEKSVQNSIHEFTTWGFYHSDPSVKRLGEKETWLIIDQLENYVNSLTKMQSNQLKNVYMIVHEYLYLRK